MSKNSEYLITKGWRLFSRRKHGMYIKERWYHPRNGAETLNQEQAVREQRKLDKAKKVSKDA
jgi:hypothetical protein